MKVVAFNGSPRKKGNTNTLITYALEEISKQGIDTEIIQLSGKNLRGCISCFKCFENLDKKCVVTNDGMNDCIAAMIEADGIIIGSPTYFANVTAETKALIDRAGLVSMANGGLLQKKVGAAVVAARRAGSVQAFDAINRLFLYSQMIVPGSNYWNMGFGLSPGDVEKDEEGINTMKVLGTNMAWLLKKIKQPDYTL